MVLLGILATMTPNSWLEASPKFSALKSFKVASNLWVPSDRRTKVYFATPVLSRPIELIDFRIDCFSPSLSCTHSHTHNAISLSYTHAHMYTHTHTHTCTHVHTHTLSLSSKLIMHQSRRKEGCKTSSNRKIEWQESLRLHYITLSSPTLPPPLSPFAFQHIVHSCFHNFSFSLKQVAVAF